MLTWLKTLLAPPTPAGTPRLLCSFKDGAEALCEDAEWVAPGEWRFHDRPSGFAPLFRVEAPEIEQCLVTFRAELRAEQTLRSVCLELLARLPGVAPRISRTTPRDLGPDREWDFFEVTVHLGRGQRPALLRFGFATENPGTLSIRNVKVLVTPVA